MRRRILHVTYLFVALFVVLVAQTARVQLIDRESILDRPGNPRRAAGNEHRGMLLDAGGHELAVSRGARRAYPAGSALAHVVGYSSPQYGESGLESALDAVISPQVEGGSAQERIASLLGGQVSAPQPASDVVLTLRQDIAAIVDAAMPADIRGAAVVLDPRNGAVLAIVNRPTFDPNHLEKDWKSLRSRADAPLLDRALDGLYPPGSTFKMFTASAALDAGVVERNDVFTDPGFVNVDGFIIHNDRGEITGMQTLTGAFSLSSNVDFAQIGLRLGLDPFYDYLHRFHAGDDVGLPVPVARDNVPAKETVSNSELAQMAFGQASLTVTPLRMALIGATIANDGVLFRPRLVKQVRTPGGRSIDVPTLVWDRPISAQTAHDVRDMMIAVVRSGTGRAAALRGVTVAGKTGTATHLGGAPHAWFVCFAPAERPRLVVAVVVEDAGYGGAVAAPIARAVLAGALPKYRL